LRNRRKNCLFQY